MKKKKIGIFVLMLLLSFSITCNAEIINNKQTNIDEEIPEIPNIIGVSMAELYKKCDYSITTIDHQNDDVYFEIKCSDCPLHYQSDWCKSGETLIFTHYWNYDYLGCNNKSIIRVKAIDSKGYESDWCEFGIQMKNTKDTTFQFSYVKQIFKILLVRLRVFL